METVRLSNKQGPDQLSSSKSTSLSPKLEDVTNRCPSLGVTDATGFVAVDDVNQVIVLSYRGSASLGNWIGNVNLGFNAFMPCKNCQVHAGFLSSWNDSKDQVKAALTQAKSANPNYAIVYTGHSLGGAITTLAAAELRQQGFPGALVCSRSPKSKVELS